MYPISCRPKLSFQKWLWRTTGSSIDLILICIPLQLWSRPNYVILFFRRKQGLEYIQRVLGPVMNTVLEVGIGLRNRTLSIDLTRITCINLISWQTDRNMELNPLTIYIKMINEAEIRTGEKTKLDRQVSPQQALEHPDVKKVVDERLDEVRRFSCHMQKLSLFLLSANAFCDTLSLHFKSGSLDFWLNWFFSPQLTDICKMFVDAILRSVNELPYGLRWICKQLASISKVFMSIPMEDTVTGLGNAT